MRTLLLSLLCAPAMAGEPLLVPDFTPATPSEVALAAMLEGLVHKELEKDGHVLIHSDAARPVVGDIIERCAERQGCPYAPLQKLPTRFAVVITIARFDDRLVGVADFYEQADPTPIASREIPIVPGDEGTFATEVRHQTQDLLELLGPAPKDDLVEAVKLVEGVGGTVEVPVPVPVPVPQPVPQPVPVPQPAPVPVPVQPPEPQGTPVERKLAGSSVELRHVRGNEGHFARYEGEAEDWVYKLTPHAGRFFIELRGGVGLGDVSRAADVRLISGDPVTQWYQEGPNTGLGGRGGLAAGYAPVTWMDLGLLVELQQGTKTLTTAFDDNEPATAVGAAVQGLAQPRARFYLAPLGPVKPALFVGGELRFFDSYMIEPNPDAFPEPPGGIVPGAVFGGALVIDPVPILGIVLEGAYTQHFGLRANGAQDGRRPAGAPSSPSGDLRTLAFTGGLQFRI